MIVLEDIDRALSSIEQSKIETSSGTASQARAGISLSALLNVLDGHGAKENHVLFMTTNHVERLDPALTRPGRIDQTFYLGYATAKMIEKLFSSFYEQSKADKNEISSLAGSFASEVPSEIFTAAKIQNFLLKYQDTPEMAVSSAADWVKKNRTDMV
jgi:chaperone BCS1